jgi:hypothetical protein
LTNSSGFQVADVLNFPNYIYGLYYFSPYLFVGTSSRTFEIYTFDNANWSLVTTFTQGDYIRDIFFFENFLYLATTNNLEVFNFTDPLNHQRIITFHGSVIPYEGYDKIYVEDDIAYLIAEHNDDLHILNVQDKTHPYFEGIFSCNDTLINLFVKDNVIYLTGRYVNLAIVQLDRFISLLNFVIYTPIAGMVAIVGIPLIVVAVIRARRRKTTYTRTPITDIIPSEEIHDPRLDTASPEDYDDPDVYALAKRLVEAAEEDL